MNLIARIIVGVVVAAVATAATSFLEQGPFNTVSLFLAFCLATVVTALLVSIPIGSDAAGASAKVGNSSTRNGGANRSAPPDDNRAQGRVKWFNVSKGFGFITKDDGDEIFVHFRSIRGGRRGLRDGQRVSFVVAQSAKGPQAEDVEALE